MDYLYFLKQRTSFIQKFYSDSSAVFRERMRKIEAKEEPYESSAGHEDSEPEFLEEWLEAGEAIDVLGQQCISMLATSLKLYLDEWVNDLVQRAGKEQLTKRRIGVPGDGLYRKLFEKGWVQGHRAYSASLGIEWNTAPVDQQRLEDVVVARNDVQHTEDISSLKARRRPNKGSAGRSEFFADPLGLAMKRDHPRLFGYSSLEITGDKLLACIAEVEAFCEWMDRQHPFSRYPPEDSG